MRLFLGLSTALMLIAIANSVSAFAQSDAVYVATYIEAAPQRIETALALLKTEVTLSRSEEGHQDVRLLREIGQDNRLVLLQSWIDQSSLEAHQNVPQVQHIRQQLEPIETAPADERILSAVWLGPALNALSGNAIWIVTHVDVMPAYTDAAAALLKSLGEQSAKEPGNLRFFVGWQAEHPNHFTVYEAWSDRMSFNAHLGLKETVKFRRNLGPMLGALYDQRLFRVVDE